MPKAIPTILPAEVNDYHPKCKAIFYREYNNEYLASGDSVAVSNALTIARQCQFAITGEFIGSGSGSGTVPPPPPSDPDPFPTFNNYGDSGLYNDPAETYNG